MADLWSATCDTFWTDLLDSGISGRVLLSEHFGTFLEMSKFNFELELSLGTGVEISQFSVDLSKLVNVFEDVMFMFFFGVSTLTCLSTFTRRWVYCWILYRANRNLQVFFC